MPKIVCAMYVFIKCNQISIYNTAIEYIMCLHLTVTNLLRSGISEKIY